MPKKNSIHIVPSEKGWDVKRQGASRASRVTRTKDEAVKVGRDMAQKESGQLIIHKKDGKIQEERTYRKDPFPPKG